MNTKLFILVISLALIFTSCKKDFLDRSPYDGVSSAVVFESDASATLAVNGIYQSAAQNAFKDQFLTVLSYMGPDGYTYGRSGVNLGTAFPMGQGTARENTIPAIYQNLYRPTVYANDVIAGLEGNENVTPELRDRLIGEAKFFRGLCYFYLWNLFGDVVMFDKPTPVEETFVARSPVAEVQALVISDFKDAIEKLPVSYSASTDVGRATKGAAIAMLGKTYLYLERWGEAATELEKLMQAPFNYDLTDNFGDSFYWQTQNNEESVFEIQYANEPNLGSVFEQRFGNRSGGRGGEDYVESSTNSLQVFTNKDGSAIDISGYPRRNTFTGSAAEVNYGKALMAWYKNTFQNADVRLHQSMILPDANFFGNDNKYYKVYWPYNTYVNADTPALRTTWTTVGVIPIRKFLTLGEENIINATTCPTNFPMIRFADVLLMYAEALNEAQGPVQQVYDAVNRVRNRAQVADLVTGLSPEQMQRAIRLERYKELMFETHLFLDTKRWRLAHTNDPVFGLNGDVVDFRFVTLYKRAFREDRDYLFPIPGGQRDLNPLLTQNPNW